MDDLPNELLLHIFGYLHAPITQFSTPSVLGLSSDLASLCRVSHHSNKLATPLLYESIERTGDINSLAFRRFPTTLLERPDLGRHIKNIRLKLGDKKKKVGESWGRRAREENSGPAAGPGVDDIPDDLLKRYNWLYELICKLIESMDIEIPFPTAYDLLKYALRGQDILLVLCAFLAPNLERLWYRQPINKMPTGTPQFVLTAIASCAFHTPIGSKCRFEKLKIIHIDLCSGWGTESPASDALPLLLLPSLIDLTLGGWGHTGPITQANQRAPSRDNDDAAFMDKPWTWPMRSSSVTRLSLIHPKVSGRMMAQMLRACKAISRLEITCFHNHSWLEDVRTALLEHADTLTELSLAENSATYSGPLGCGPYLTSLKSLRAPLDMLVRSKTMLRDRTGDELVAGLVNALPPNIEHLWVDLHKSVQEDEEIECYFTGLYEACKDGRFPYLKDIYLRQNPVGDKYFKGINKFLSKVTNLRDHFRTCSVSLDFHMLYFCGFVGPAVTAQACYVEPFQYIQRVHTHESGKIDGRYYKCQGPPADRLFIDASTCLPRQTPEEIQDDRSSGYT